MTFYVVISTHYDSNFFICMKHDGSGNALFSVQHQSTISLSNDDFVSAGTLETNFSEILTMSVILPRPNTDSLVWYMVCRTWTFSYNLSKSKGRSLHCEMLAVVLTQF